MAINLQKGGNVNLSKTDPTLNEILIGLGWDARATDGVDFDLDASAFLLNKDGRCISENHMIFYNNGSFGDQAVVYGGDNRTGAGEGDDETIDVNLAKLPQDVDRIVITVTIHEADQRKQSFGQVSNASIRLVNKATGAEVLRYDLTEDASTETAMQFGEIYRNGSDWKFRAIGQGYAGGLAAMVRQFGLSVGG